MSEVFVNNSWMILVPQKAPSIPNEFLSLVMFKIFSMVSLYVPRCSTFVLLD